MIITDHSFVFVNAMQTIDTSEYACDFCGHKLEAHEKNSIANKCVICMFTITYGDQCTMKAGEEWSNEMYFDHETSIVSLQKVRNL